MTLREQEWINPAAVPLERCHGAVAVSHKYQNLKELQKAMISTIENYIISNIISCSTKFVHWMGHIIQVLWILEALLSTQLSK